MDRWIVAALVAIVLLGWWLFRPAKPVAITPPVAPVVVKPRKLPPKVDIDERVQVEERKGSTIEMPKQPTGPTFGDSLFGQKQGSAPGANGGDSSLAGQKKAWLARWFPGLSGESGQESGGGVTPGSGDTSLGQSGAEAAKLKLPLGVSKDFALLLKSGGVPNFGLKKSHELGPGGGQATKNPTFIQDTFAAQNQVIIQQFGTNAHLYVPLIPGTQYLTLNLDVGLEGINIYHPLQGTNVSIVAKAGVVTQQQIELFLGEGDTGLPALAGVTAPSSLGAPTVIPATAGSGLQDSKTWMFVSNGYTVQIALMVRVDLQGSYLAVVKAQGENVTNAEEFYAQYFEQLKIL